MAAKRQHIIDYAEDSYTDEEDEMEMEMDMDVDRKRQPGRPRKPSVTMGAGPAQLEAPTARRRGRGPSKRPCLNRNALMARENRQRKKEYIERIENKLKFYQQEHVELNTTIQKQALEIKKLTNDVNYLKTVLKNSTLISNLLASMNDSLSKVHAKETANKPTDTTTLPVRNNFTKSSTDVVNWVVNGQTNSTNTNNLSVPLSGTPMRDNTLEAGKEDGRRIGQIVNNTGKIARKTMPLNNFIPKMENPSSVESMLEDDEPRFTQKSSPESNSFCEYNIDKSSAGNDNQLPTTPMSTLSTSLDKGDASLSDTDFSQLSSFNVDLFDNIDKIDEVANPLQFEQDTRDIFNEETLFHTLEKETGLLNNDAVVDPLEINKMSEALNDKILFQSVDNTGVCLHINSRRVSLEYCSICHLNSLNSQII